MSVSAALDAIVENPDDDELRLRYAELIADFDPRLSELIHLQVERSRRERAGARRRSRPTSRELDLIAAIDEQATRTLRKYVARSGKRYEYHRGLVAMVRIDAGVFLEHTDWIFRMAPIEHIDFEPRSSELGDLLASPALARLRSIGLRAWQLGDEGAAMVAACPYLSRCQHLDLSINRIGRAGWKALVASPQTRSILVVNHQQNDELPISLSYHGPDHRHVPGELEPWSRELEAQYGPTPWLHPELNAADRYQASYLVEAGFLPAA